MTYSINISITYWLLAIFLLAMPFLGYGQQTSLLVLDAQKVHFTKVVADSISSPQANRYHCRIKLELPTPKRVAAIRLKVIRTGNGNEVRKARIPLNRGNHRRKKVGLIRQGKDVWLDLGTIPGNPNYTAKIRLEDRKGRLSQIVTVQL